ncbi:hypothetical protein LA6_001190 [Marinibacterium anthonyi]|nr:hypothetical protein LA6_001190 [Marinibacterium anthonyi]
MSSATASATVKLPPDQASPTFAHISSGAAAGQYLLDQGAGDIVLKDYLMTNMKDFRAVLRETIIEDARAYQKKAA